MGGGDRTPLAPLRGARRRVHHVREFANGGRTSVDNGALLCGYHHREFAALGWSCRMIDGVPHWTAPDWLDPTRTPRRNTTHDPIGAAGVTAGDA